MSDNRHDFEHAGADGHGGAIHLSEHGHRAANCVSRADNLLCNFGILRSRLATLIACSGPGGEQKDLGQLIGRILDGLPA